MTISNIPDSADEKIGANLCAQRGPLTQIRGLVGIVDALVCLQRCVCALHPQPWALRHRDHRVAHGKLRCVSDATNNEVARVSDIGIGRQAKAPLDGHAHGVLKGDFPAPPDPSILASLPKERCLPGLAARARTIQKEDTDRLKRVQGDAR